MKVVITIQVILGVFSLFLTFYGGYLLYQHVHATDLMWFIYWMNMPFVIVVNVVATLLGRYKK